MSSFALVRAVEARHPRRCRASLRSLTSRPRARQGLVTHLLAPIGYYMVNALESLGKWANPGWPLDLSLGKGLPVH